MYSVGEKIGPHEDDVEQVAAVVAGREHVHRHGDALGAFAVAEVLGDRRGVRDAGRDGDGQVGLQIVEDLGEVRRVRLVDREDDGFADASVGSFCASLRNASHMSSIAARREDLPFQVLNLEVLVLLVDDDRPALFRERLGRDVGAHVENLRQTEERTFRVFDCVDDVIAEGGQPGSQPK